MPTTSSNGNVASVVASASSRISSFVAPICNPVTPRAAFVFFALSVRRTIAPPAAVIPAPTALELSASVFMALEPLSPIPSITFEALSIALIIISSTAIRRLTSAVAPRSSIFAQHFLKPLEFHLLGIQPETVLNPGYWMLKGVFCSMRAVYSRLSSWRNRFAISAPSGVTPEMR